MFNVIDIITGTIQFIGDLFDCREFLEQNRECGATTYRITAAQE